MRKFLMAAGLLALVACGDKKPDAAAGATMAPAATDTTKKDTSSMSGMSGMNDTTKKDTSKMAAPATGKP